MTDPLFVAREISKRYAVPVLHGVDLDLAPGEIHALLGANGAGKSTLCKIVAGLIPASSGVMQLGGVPFSPRNKAEAERAGVQTVQQELNLIPTLSVAENLFLKRLPRRFGCVRFAELDRRAHAALARVGLESVDPRALVATLGVGTQQLVEIASALARECRVLLLDEPTAALSGGEIEHLFARLRELRTQGVGMVYVSHRLEEVLAVSDRITILRDGRRVATLPTAGTTVATLTAHMTGEATPAEAAFRSHRRAEVAIRVEQMTRGSAVRDVSFAVRRGERFGIAGLVGSGRTELLRAVFGADRADAGAVYLGDDPTPWRFAHPREAVAHALALVTEDRKHDGVLLTQSVRANVTLAALGAVSRRLGVVSRVREHQAAARQAAALDIRCRSIEQIAAELSGGNQQKTALAKWLHRDAEVFLLDEPTRGIDIAARHRIYGVLEQLAAAGKALVIVSSDLEELVATCDTIAVMARGRIVASFERGQWTRGQITAAAFGGGNACGRDGVPTVERENERDMRSDEFPLPAGAAGRVELPLDRNLAPLANGRAGARPYPFRCEVASPFPFVPPVLEGFQNPHNTRPKPSSPHGDPAVDCEDEGLGCGNENWGGAAHAPA